ASRWRRPTARLAEARGAAASRTAARGARLGPRRGAHGARGARAPFGPGASARILAAVLARSRLRLPPTARTPQRRAPRPEVVGAAPRGPPPLRHVGGSGAVRGDPDAVGGG